MFMRRAALLSALTAFAIPEMHAEPAEQASLSIQSERHMAQPVGLSSTGMQDIQVVPTQRWVF
jgi:hypothetical protein